MFNFDMSDTICFRYLSKGVTYILLQRLQPNFKLLSFKKTCVFVYI